MEYNWCDYYQKAYEAEKKKNTVLAGKVADAEGKWGELWEKYAAICKNPLYKMTQFPALFVGAGRKLKHAGAAMLRGRSGEEEIKTPEEFSGAYEERLRCQRDVYGQWISESEPAVWNQYLNMLPSEGKMERCSCQVVSYRDFAGAKELSHMVKDTAEGGAEPDILLFAADPGELDERAVSFVEKWFAAYPNTKLLYGAEDHKFEGKRCFPWFKPCWSPDTLLGFFCFGSYFAVDRAWAERTALSGYAEERCNLYDFVLRLLRPFFEKPAAVNYDRDNTGGRGFYYTREENLPPEEGAAPEIVCLDLVLYHQNSATDFDVPAGRYYYLDVGRMRQEDNPEFWGYEKEYIKLKQDFINSMGYECRSCQTGYPEVWSVVPAFVSKAGGDTCFLSVVILSKDHPELLKKCIGSFLERTSLEGLKGHVEFIVVDNGSNAENRQIIQDFLESADAACRYLCRPMEFNFSAMCNLGVKEAEGEYILLLNDDVEILEKNWLHIMLGQAMMPGTGAVGAKLWYPKEEQIQHAGVTNMHIGPSHKMTTFPDDRIYYYGHNAVTYDMIAVTAACLLVRRSLYEEMGGLNEEMAVAYNDVDFCFKLAEAGYRNVLRNDAVLLHHESASRGADDMSEEKWQRLIQEKTNLYRKHPRFHKYDPYYSEQLTDNACEYRSGYLYPYERLLLTAKPEKEQGKAKLQKAFSQAVMPTVDKAGKQNKIYLEDPEIIEFKGWCYIQRQDNCLFERWLILEADQDDFYYQVPVQEWLRPDVEAILPQEKNIELSGFTCRILKDDLVSGSYKVGMLYRNLCSGKLFYKCSDKFAEIG